MSIVLCLLVLVSMLLFGLTLSSTAQTPDPAESDDIERRVASILEQMTLQEKIEYLGGVDRFDIRSISRLGIPRFKMADGPLGVRNYGPSTAMAAGIALAASWDTALAERVGAAIGRDARAKGVHFLLGPGVNIYRAAMNGRNFEYLGEDPFLAGAIAAGFIRGVQGQGVCATVKHYAGNNSEFDRRRSNALIDQRTLREMYLPAFEMAIRDARVGAVMTSYNLVNGRYMSQNGPLINDILKKEWGFDGIVMSDWTSTYDGVEAANGGLDLEMPSAVAMNRYVLLQAIAEETVSTKTIDDKVARILRTAVRFGWLDRDQKDLGVPRYSRDGADAALEAARNSMVLLKNEGGLLPLRKEALRTIAVIGPNAHPAQAAGGGSARVEPFNAVGFMEGLSNALHGYADVHYHPGIPSLAAIADATPWRTSPDGAATGMHLEMFNNMQLAGDPVLTCIERHVGAGEKAAAIPEPFSSTRWTGYYTPPVAGTYDIFVQIPGERIGYRLYLDDSPVVDAWKFSRALLDTTRAFLSAGPHKIVLELVRRGEGFTGGKLRLGIAPTENLVDPDAVGLAEKADAVVVAVGYDPETESESGDRTFGLPLGQDALIGEMAAANSRTIVVIVSGGGVDMRRWLDRVPAVLAAWYPGQQGGSALSEILLGDTNPSGRLPVTLESRWEDNPTCESYYPQPDTDDVPYVEGILVGYRGYEGKNVAPLFPFGFGLSYTEFQYSDLNIEPLAPGEAPGGSSGFLVTFTVENTGKRAGSDVAQLYVGSRGVGALPRPPKELKGFKKIALGPGERQTVSICLDRRAFCYYDVQNKDWRVEEGERDILVGRSSAEIVLRGTTTLAVMEKP